MRIDKYLYMNFFHEVNIKKADGPVTYITEVISFISGLSIQDQNALGEPHSQ